MHTLTIGTTENGRPVDAIVIRYELVKPNGPMDPYFSIAATEYKNGYKVSAGFIPDKIIQARPDLKPLVLLHYSYLTGEPINAEANGWFWLAGAAGGLGEQFHGSANIGGGMGELTPAECQAMLAVNLRITPAEAAALVQAATDPATARQQFSQYIASQRHRWKAEADAAIQQFNLTVTGDKWK